MSKIFDLLTNTSRQDPEDEAAQTTPPRQMELLLDIETPAAAQPPKRRTRRPKPAPAPDAPVLEDSAAAPLAATEPTPDPVAEPAPDPTPVHTPDPVPSIFDEPLTPPTPEPPEITAMTNDDSTQAVLDPEPDTSFAPEPDTSFEPELDSAFEPKSISAIEVIRLPEPEPDESAEDLQDMERQITSLSLHLEQLNLELKSAHDTIDTLQAHCRELEDTHAAHAANLSPIPAAESEEFDQLRRAHESLQKQLDTSERDIRAKLAVAEANHAQIEARLEEAQRVLREEQKRRTEDVAKFGEKERNYQEQIRRIREIERIRTEQAKRTIGPIPTNAIWIAASAALMLGVIGFLAGRMASPDRTPRPAHSTPATGASAPAVAAAPVPVPGPSAGLPPATRPTPDPSATSGVKPALPVTAAKTQPTAAPTAASGIPSIQMQGVKLRTTESGTYLVVFDYGVFTRRADISNRARQDLKTLAEQLRKSLNRYRLEIEGHTDADPVAGAGPITDNRELGYQRAKAVQDYLRKSCGLPAASMTATSVGDANPPHPNSSQESRKKNRTVVLKLVPIM